MKQLVILIALLSSVASTAQAIDYPMKPGSCVQNGTGYTAIYTNGDKWGYYAFNYPCPPTVHW